MKKCSYSLYKLIIVTGTPCSGKTYRAQQIQRDFEARIDSSSNRSIVYLPSHHASLDTSCNEQSPLQQANNPRDVIYENARQEKIARAEEFSAIKKAVNKNTIVIADAANYIKGFRYQLFCEAKAAATRSVVVHTAAREDECLTWNNVRLEARGWSTREQEHLNTSISDPQIGKDILGNLEPESHTAIYGDKVIEDNKAPSSPTSSTGAALSDDDEATAQQRQRAEDTMTLKSLYISDNQRSGQENNGRQPLHSIHERSTPARPLPPSEPPSPGSSLPYAPTTFRSLFMRYEPPSPFTRWDTPLFTIPSTDPHPPYDAIWDAIFPTPAKSTSKKAQLRERQETERIQKEKEQQQHANNTALNGAIPVAGKAHIAEVSSAVRQNAATVLPTATAPNALQVLESTTGEIAKMVLSVARECDVENGQEAATLTLRVNVEDGQVAELEVEKPEGVSVNQPKLQRLRRKYTMLQRGGIAHGQGYTQGKRNVAEGFVKFLETEWAVEVGV